MINWCYISTDEPSDSAVHILRISYSPDSGQFLLSWTTSSMIQVSYTILTVWDVSSGALVLTRNMSTNENQCFLSPKDFSLNVCSPYSLAATVTIACDRLCTGNQSSPELCKDMHTCIHIYQHSYIYTEREYNCSLILCIHTQAHVCINTSLVCLSG